MIQVLNKRILLEPHKVTSTKGIITPDEVEYYVVYAVGDEIKKLKKGDKVLYDNGRKYKVLKDDYILTDEENIVLKI